MIKIDSKKHDLGGGMIVQRILPDRQKRMVGPFCFLDRMGPVVLSPGQNTDVRPHPHIGLSTLTYLFEGRIVHRDSLGVIQTIEPGEVNWMTAGKGISHSERAHVDDQAKSRNLHGLQFWIALPDDQEDTEPHFQHYSLSEIPEIDDGFQKITLIAGDAFGMRSKVETTSDLIFMSIESYKKTYFELNKEDFELAIFVLSGKIKVADQTIIENQMIVFENGIVPKVDVTEKTQFIVFGGRPFKTPRLMWWNLVSSSAEKITEAKTRWKNKTFPMVPGETEFIPLPEI